MSRYSGKCDLCDLLVGRDKLPTVYLGNEILPLRADELRDLVPYYPRIVCNMESDGDLCVMRISNESWVDTSERQTLEFYLKCAISYCRKLKRRKVQITEDMIIGHIAWGFSPVREHQQEIARRVMEKGEKADIKGIHIDTSDYYRENLYDVMLQYGYQESIAYIWCFGYDRYYQRNS